MISGADICSPSGGVVRLFRPSHILNCIINCKTDALPPRRDASGTSFRQFCVSFVLSLRACPLYPSTRVLTGTLGHSAALAKQSPCTLGHSVAFPLPAPAVPCGREGGRGIDILSRAEDQSSDGDNRVNDHVQGR